MIEAILTILGLVLFLLPGALLCYILLPKSDVIERATFSLALSVGFSGIIAIALYCFNFLSQLSFFVVFVLLTLFLSLIIFKKAIKEKEQYKTTYHQSILFIFLFSIFGTLWRYLFSKSINNFNNPYAYSFKFIKEQVPNLGFYTGMALDKSRYFGGLATAKILEYLGINFSTIGTFLIVFLSLGFIFLLFREYRINKQLAYLGVAVMSVGPIELFYANTLLYGHSLSYVILLPLFLLFKSKNRNLLFLIVLLFSIIMATTYYTASIITILCSFGFLMAIIIKHLFETKNIKKTAINIFQDKKFWCFFFIFLIISFYVYFFSEMFNYGFGRTKDFSDFKIATNKVETIIGLGIDTNKETSTLYQDPTFLGLSAIRWQMLFFFLCGLTFIFYLITKREFTEENIDLILCLLPVIMISYGFFHVNLPARIFSYFAFFGLMNLRLPKRYFKTIFILCLVFIVVSGFYVAKDKKVFLDISDGEITAAKEISASFKGKIFSDQVFINQLILNGYYDVTGANDKDQIVKNLFYQTDKNVFGESINYLKKSNVSYIVITKRMREQYVLMLNYPQKNIFNAEMYERYLNKVYDNGYARVYETNFKNTEN